MPIPQLKPKKKFEQSWRTNQERSSSVLYSNNRNNHKSYTFKPLHGRSKSHTNSHKYMIMNMVYLLLISCIMMVLAGFTYVLIVSRDLPDPNRLIDRDIAESTKIYDRTGQTILFDIHGLEQRTIVNINELPEYIKWATITAEDRKFYEHHGFDILGIIKGVIIDPLTGKGARGGSTLTQQLVKNAILTNERTLSRKIKEFILSYRIENKFSKDEILQLYFNEIPYGSTAYGVEAGARRYFDISAKDLNLAQATILASLPQRPSYLSPYGSHIDELFARQKWILNNMAELGYITEEQKNEALGFDVKFKEPTTSIIAPHFVMYVRELLSEKYGDQVIENEGLKIYTTIDLYKQQIAEEVVKERGEKNATDYNANNGSLVSLDPKTGQILAMVGSRDYFNNDIDGQVNVTIRNRQPGSSLKPIVYASSFIKGYTPNTILYDVVTNFAVNGATKYEPHNYNLKENGPVSIRKALAGSLNIPAVKTLYLVGVKNVTDLAQKMGYSTLNNPDRYGLSLVLGGGEVKLLEHTAAYGVFAREGEYHPPVAILKIEDRNGKIIEEYKDKKEKVLDANIARMINDVLSDNEARAYAFGANNWLTLNNRPVGAKTGTTNDYRDAWTIGYTPSLVTGVWVGNNDNSEMTRGAAGGVIAAPIWNEYMRRVLGDTPMENFKKPEIPITGKAVIDGEGAGQVTVKIDSVSGLLASKNTPPELIIEKKFQQPHSILYYVNPKNPLGAEPKEGEYDIQYPVWEEAIKSWAQREKINIEEAPTEYDNQHKPENMPDINIISPNNNSVVTSAVLNVKIAPVAEFGINRAEYYIDSHLIDFITRYPYNLSANINFLNNGGHTLSVKVCDMVENCRSENIQFNLVLDEDAQDQSLSFAWISPNNSTIKKTDFPIQLKTLSYKPQGIKEVNFYALKIGQNTPQLIATTKETINNEIIAFWQTPPDNGLYQIYAEAIGLNNNNRKTDVVKIIIND